MATQLRSTDQKDRTHGESSVGSLFSSITFLVISGIVGLIAALVTIAGPSLGWYRNKRDSGKIIEFLRRSRRSGYRFRSPHAIASETKIPDARVAELAGQSRKLRRNRRRRLTWQLDE
jgi:hypothetical protein